jgi:hypothetical protein
LLRVIEEGEVIARLEKQSKRTRGVDGEAYDRHVNNLMDAVAVALGVLARGIADIPGRAAQLPS